MELFVQYEITDRVAYITMNRPEKRNALSAEMVTQLKVAVQKAEKDDSCKVVVLAATGEAFCAGADLGYLKQLQENSYEENLHDSRHLMELYKMIYLSSKVYISRIQGPAIAGGCGLASICDFSYAVPEAKFGYTEVRIGFIPAIVKVFLIRKIGEGKAREILLTGDVFSAEKAEKMGLINQVIPAENLNDFVHQFASKLCNVASGDSLALTKRMIAEVQNRTLDDALDYAAAENAEARAGADCKRGISAFLNKEKITW
ncbi:MAG: enoyl-CoA hydratase/isomerase family protein [Bacteroidetes bacterium]|nr:enoyl-CoA hydratase/isomerase family protein [Bacteroidota bacterium]